MQIQRDVLIHRIRGASMREALLRAQAEFGDDAVVIQEEQAPGGGVTLSVARRAAPTAPGGVLDAALNPARQATAPVQDATRVPLVREVATRLRATGTSEALVQTLCAELRDWPDPGVHVMDRAAAALGRRFPAVKLGRLARGTRILAFVGLTGVGKTTTLVKLAARMLRAERRVELATLDSQRVGAVEQLRAWSQDLGVPLTVLRPGVRPHASTLEGAGVDAVLLDTTGNPLADVARLTELRRTFHGTRVEFGAWLVLPATASRAALELVTQAYRGLELAGAVVTKLDETREPAVALEHAHAHGLGLAFLSDGPDVALHLRRSGPEECADLFLRGRLS